MHLISPYNITTEMTTKRRKNMLILGKGRHLFHQQIIYLLKKKQRCFKEGAS